MKKSVLLNLLLIFFLLGCESEKSQSGVDVFTNGSHSFTSDSPELAGVMKILTNRSGLCTGQAVSTSTMLTAAHCIEGFLRQPFVEVCIESGINADECSTNFHIPDEYLQGQNPQRSVFDVAIVQFDRPIFDSYFAVRHDENPLATGDEFYIIGYSPNNPDPGQSLAVSAQDRDCVDTGCWGDSRVQDYIPEIDANDAPVTEAVTILSSINEGVVTRGGDSGGPAIDKEFCSLFGVLSRGDEFTNLHTNLTYTPVKNWLLNSVQDDNSIYICGIHGNDPEHCSLDGLYFPKKDPVTERINCVSLNSDII